MALLLLALLAGSLEGDPAFEKAQDLYQQLDFDGALVELERAAKSGRHEGGDLATLHLWVGLSHAQLGRFREANEAFYRAVMADPEITLPEGVSPKIQWVFTDAQQRARAALEPEPAPQPAAEARAEPQPAASTGLEPEPEPDGQPAREPGPVSQAAAEPASGLATVAWAGSAFAGAGGALLVVGSLALFGLSFVIYLQAQDPTTTQASAALGGAVANGLWIGSLAAGALGGLALAGCAGAATLAVSLE